MARKALLAVALFLTALLSACNSSESPTPTNPEVSSQSPNERFYSYVNGEKWEFSVADTDLVNVPVWRVAEDAPPLPPRAAIRSAREMLQTLLADGSEWEFHRVALQLQRMRTGPDAWVYLVDFVSPFTPPSGFAGSISRSQVTLVVLMDGRAVAPVRSPYSHDQGR